MHIGQTYLRGQIWFAKFPYDFKKEDREDTVIRPVIIISNDKLNRDANRVLVAPLTKQKVTESQLHVPINFNRSDSTILIDNMKTVLKEDMETYQFTASEKMMSLIDEAVLMAVGMKPMAESQDLELDDHGNEDDIDEYYNMSLPKTTSKRRYFTKEKKLDYLNDFQNALHEKEDEESFVKRWNLTDRSEMYKLAASFQQELGV